MTFTIREKEMDKTKQRIRFQKFRSLVLDGDEREKEIRGPATPFVKELIKTR